MYSYSDVKVKLISLLGLVFLGLYGRCAMAGPLPQMGGILFSSQSGTHTPPQQSGSGGTANFASANRAMKKRRLDRL